MSERIGFIGLGRMGRPMAANLQRKGFQLTVFDLHETPMDILAQLGAAKAASVAELAENADMVITMLPGSPEVEAVALGPGGILAHGQAGMLIMDMSTVDPASTDRLAAAAGEAGLSLVDAPVGRLASHADDGESLFMVGAADANFARLIQFDERVIGFAFPADNVGKLPGEIHLLLEIRTDYGKVVFLPCLRPLGAGQSLEYCATTLKPCRYATMKCNSLLCLKNHTACG